MKLCKNLSIHEIEKEYSDLFKAIGLMKGEISIKSKDGAIPHIELVRRVPCTQCRNL